MTSIQPSNNVPPSTPTRFGDLNPSLDRTNLDLSLPEDSFTPINKAKDVDSSQDSSPERPQYLYHLTTKNGWENIQRSKGMQPYPDPMQTGIHGIWTVDLKDFINDWGKLDMGDGTFSGLAALSAHTRIKNSIESPIADQKMVLLKIKVDPDDKLAVRENKHLLHDLDDTKFIDSLKDLKEYPKLPTESGLLPEFIVQNDIPLDRIEVFSTPSSFPLLIPELEKEHLFSPFNISPDQKETVQNELGFDLDKAKNTHGAHPMSGQDYETIQDTLKDAAKPPKETD